MKTIDILKNLVEIDTTNELANEKVLATWLKDFLLPFADKVEFVGDNLIAYFGNLTSKNILLFNGHLDVVKADKKEWDTDPFKLTIKNGLAYGRGTADMKSGIAISLQSIIKAKQADLLKEKLIIFAGTVDEESGSCSSRGACLVAKYFKEKNIKPLGCLIPEPSGKNIGKINLGHRGFLWLKCKSNGKSMHSGLINIEDNAINKMIDFVKEVQKIFTNQPIKVNKIPQTSCRVLFLKGGEDIFNKIPAFCESNLDIRISPTDSASEILNQIQAIASKNKVEISIFKKCNSSETNENEKITKTLLSVIKETNFASEIGYASPTCDAHWFSEIGIPTINGLGAKGDNIHSPNEFIEISSLKEIEKIHFNLIKIW